MRFLVSRRHDPGGLGLVAPPRAAGADHGVRVFAVATALLIPTRTAADLYAGWWQPSLALGAVPRVLVWDGEGAIGRWRAGGPN